MKSYRSVLLAASLGLWGCGTIATQLIPEETCSYAADHQDRSGCRDISRMYSGVQGNLCWLGSEMQLFVFLDLPLSLVGDTLLLPVTAYQQATRGGLCPENAPDAGAGRLPEAEPPNERLQSTPASRSLLGPLASGTRPLCLGHPIKARLRGVPK